MEASQTVWLSQRWSRDDFPLVIGNISPLPSPLTIAAIEKPIREFSEKSGTGGTPRVVLTGMWGRSEQETLARLEARNQPIHRVRARIEKIFGTWKRCYGLRRMRWRGLAKAAGQVYLTAIAYNLK